jgi:hypothetical protein
MTIQAFRQKTTSGVITNRGSSYFGKFLEPSEEIPAIPEDDKNTQGKYSKILEQLKKINVRDCFEDEFFTTNRTNDDIETKFIILLNRQATTGYPYPRITDELSNILGRCDQEISDETGESDLSINLKTFIKKYRAEAIDAIDKYVDGKDIDETTIARILYIIGQSTDPISYIKRKSLLLKHLSSFSPRIRYGAMLGLSENPDPSVIGAVKAALERENTNFVRGALLQLVDYLNTANSHVK